MLKLSDVQEVNYGEDGFLLTCRVHVSKAAQLRTSDTRKILGTAIPYSTLLVFSQSTPLIRYHIDVNNLTVRPSLRLVLRFLIIMTGFLILIGSVATSYACELEELSSEEQGVYRRHLVGVCTPEEREALAVSTELLFQAIQAGKSIDLQGVLIVGDLMFDRLPLQALNTVSVPSAVAQQIVTKQNIQKVRIIPGSISVRDSVIKGNWATNLRNEVLLILDDLVITGTTFQQSVDFSQTVFLRTVDFSTSNIQYEGFFIRTHFEGPANFDDMKFGTHSRFHKARFRQDVSFVKSRFAGLAEFLEVQFEKGAYFTHALFSLGTGFSGAEFFGPSNFSQTEFHREAFFRFATFQETANFGHAIFKEVSDFTEVKFVGSTDFTAVEFFVPSNFSGTKLENKWDAVNKKKYVSEYLAAILAFLGFLCFLVWGVRKWRQSL